MAELTNQREGAGRLAVHIDVLRSDDQPGPIVRGAVFTAGSGEDMCWLRVTFWVGECAIFQQDVMVQWPSIRNWPHDLDTMAQTHGSSGWFGLESPELFIEVEPIYLEPAARLKPEEDYGYEVLIGVDTGIAAGEFSVASEGPAMRFFPSLEEIRQFARDLKAEARFVRLLEGLDAADFDYEAARLFWPFDEEDDMADGADWSI